jgi:hypothetical protein
MDWSDTMNAEEYDAYRKTIGTRSQAALESGDIESFVKMQVCHWAFAELMEDSIGLDTSFRECFSDDTLMTDGPADPHRFGRLSKMSMVVGFGYFGYEIHLTEQEASGLDTIREIADLLRKTGIDAEPQISKIP